ncbi:MAG: glycosyl transferase family protein, partial [Microgenomates group bacterium LiPW_16]
MKKINKQSLLLILILILAIFTRFFRLDQPNTFMFDEVYHAFTAREMARGNKMAWEWWNKPPEGFAYEWTHPPLAKEAMVAGIKVFGENSFGWRFPIALAGVGVVYLVYLLGKQLFNDQVGLIAAFLITFDGLFFVQSRIGMNDTFFLFFMLLAFWAYTKYHKEGHEVPQMLFLVGVALGLALASKWTAIYAILILGGLWLINILKTKNLKLKTLFIGACSFLIIPLIVYLLSYLPFFTSGHTWEQFWGLQHQMWWYHTRLKATHPYTSPWYSWPFLYRPVWYYVKYGEDTIANIYALGNPAVWWGGVIAILYFILSYIRGILAKKFSIRVPFGRFQFSILLLGYFGFFLPWAFSPRIMFLYHYLPSIPFMCLALGYGLDKIWQRNRLL